MSADIFLRDKSTGANKDKEIVLIELTSAEVVCVKLRWQGHWHSSRMLPGA